MIILIHDDTFFINFYYINREYIIKNRLYLIFKIKDFWTHLSVYF